MLKRLIHIAFFLALATVAGAQYLPGTLQGGPPAPGTKSRSPLNSLERTAEGVSGATIVTDVYGNQRFAYYVRVFGGCVNYSPMDTTDYEIVSSFVYQCGPNDSLFYVDWSGAAVLISTGGGSSINWYNTDATTTDPTRTATVLQSAEWVGDDPSGYLLWQIGTLSGGRVLADANVSTIYFTDASGNQEVETDATGVNIRTTNSATRAVDIITDTVNTRGSFDDTNFRLNFVSDSSYLYADSAQVVGLGDFPAFPEISGEGRDKGLHYRPLDGGVTLYNGSYPYDNINMGAAQALFFANAENTDPADYRYTYFQGRSDNGLGILSAESLLNRTTIDIRADEIIDDGWRLTFGRLDTTEQYVLSFDEYPPDGRSLAFSNTNTPRFDFFQINVADHDTIDNAIRFYNRAYYWKNEHPTGAVGDTLLHFWAATGAGGEAGKDPGFMTLNQIRGVNWYNANGTTTDNTRIATVTETATWLSSDVEADGVYPFRFELAGASPNEPEMMVYKFPAGDSATLSQSDQEIIWFSSNIWSIKSNEYTSVQADSFQYNPNAGGTAFKVGANNVITQNAPTGTPTHRDAILYNTITGTAQTEVFLDGSSAVWTLPTNSAQNAKIHVTAVCSSAGNGVGISTGEAYASWHLGGIKRITNTTSLVGAIQTAATAQSDAGMSTSVVTIDADDTDDSLRIRFTPPSTAGSSTVIRVSVSLEIIQTSY